MLHYLSKKRDLDIDLIKRETDVIVDASLTRKNASSTAYNTDLKGRQRVVDGWMDGRITVIKISSNKIKIKIEVNSRSN
jgi:hypothetical protein